MDMDIVDMDMVDMDMVDITWWTNATQPLPLLDTVDYWTWT